MVDFSKIKALAFDVDGVCTNGGVLCVESGDLYREFDAKDGFSIRMATMHAYPVAVITGGSSETIRKRFHMYDVPDEDIYLHSRDKVEDFMDFAKKHNLKPEEVAFMGDDMPDVPVMQVCFGTCPCDAVPEAIEAATWVSTKPGGKGAVRELVESVLKAHGDWTFDSKRYKKLF